MRNITLTTSGVSASAVAALDTNVTPISVSVAIRVTGSATYTLQLTCDDIYAPTFNPATATWFTAPSLAADQTTTQLTSFTIPVTGVRVNQTVGVGSTDITVIQAGTI